MLKRILLGVALAALAWAAYEWITFPDVAALADERPATTAFMERRKEQLRKEGKSDQLEWKWVSYSRISPNLRRAVLVAEDNAFYDHEGVDLEAMREAWKTNLERRRLVYGGSTITQQLAKNLYLSPSRNPLRKVREYLIARSLEKNLSKKRILEIYLNVIELGERVYGAEAGARHYFGKSAAALTPAQAALLAGSLPNPRVMNPASPNRRLRARQAMILSRMKRWGTVAEREELTERKPVPENPVPAEAPEPTMTDVEPAPTVTEPGEEIMEPPVLETTPTETETAPATNNEVEPAEPPTTGTDGRQ